MIYPVGVTAGDVGLALTQVLELTGYLEWAIRTWADLENSMTAVERALEYTSLEQEPKNGISLEKWPSEASITFEAVTLRYEGCKSPVLNEISFAVKSQEKIGIVGRTGAGKSSIITVLYRLYEFDGIVEIDGVDSKTVSMDSLRYE